MDNEANGTKEESTKTEAGAPNAKKWHDILGSVVKLPGLKVDRNAFLTEKFSTYYTNDKLTNLLEGGPKKAGVPLYVSDAIAKNVIGKHGNLATGTSFLAGLPGGLAILGTIPADLAQYYYHTLKTAQELAYIYGYPDLSEGGEDNFRDTLTILVGVMMGSGEAGDVLRQISKAVGQVAVKGLLWKVAWSTIDRRILHVVAGFLSKIIPAKIGAMAFAKWIPLVGGFVSGGVTAFMFFPSANRLKNALREEWGAD